MRIFRFLAPSPQETRAFYVFAFGAFLGQLVAFALFLAAPNAGAGAIAIGGGLAILYRFGRATWEFDFRSRRARKSRVELQREGLLIVDERGEKFVRWEEISSAESRGGRLQIKFRGQKWSFGAREIENGMALTQEILNRVARSGKTTSNFIPLTPS